MAEKRRRNVPTVRTASVTLPKVSGVIDASNRNPAAGTMRQVAATDEIPATLKVIVDKTRRSTEAVMAGQNLMQDTGIRSSSF